MTVSFLFIPPTSPCNASPALIKLEEDPVLDRVAETFFAICPDLPIPRVITVSYTHLTLPTILLV